jgi:pentatricopeptide repeat protein
MESEGHPANAVTLSSILKACGRAGAVEKGKCTHGMIVDKGMLEKDIVLGNGVIDMYARCGMLARAQQVLEELPYRNEVSWSALIAGCARRGKAHMALECFERMQREGLSPDRVAFACVLSACSHAGLLGEARLVLESMTRNYGLAPKIEHLTSMVVSLGCAGQLEKAMSTTINVMSSYDRSAEAWLAVLAACRRWGNVQLGRLAFDQAIHSWK